MSVFSPPSVTGFLLLWGVSCNLAIDDSKRNESLTSIKRGKTFVGGGSVVAAAGCRNACL